MGFRFPSGCSFSSCGHSVHGKFSHSFPIQSPYCIGKQFHPGLTEQRSRKRTRSSSLSGFPLDHLLQSTINPHSKTSCDITPPTGAHSQDRLISIWKTTGSIFGQSSWSISREEVMRAFDRGERMGLQPKGRGKTSVSKGIHM